jgi:hypothetical protein
LELGNDIHLEGKDSMTALKEKVSITSSSSSMDGWDKIKLLYTQETYKHKGTYFNQSVYNEIQKYQ